MSMQSPLVAAAKGLGRLSSVAADGSVSALRVALNSTLPGSTNPGLGASPSGALLRDAPIGVKANLCTNGMMATAGSRALGSYVAPYTSTALARAQAVGARVTSVCNMDEFGMGSASASSFHGPAYNPYSAPTALAMEIARSGDTVAVRSFLSADLEGTWLTPGGSSGGSAAAVASGEVFAAFGSDTGGSVRQPASFCGVVGLKPSYGRLSRWGLIAYASSLDTVGLLTRSVADAALLFDVCAGHDSRDDTSLRLPALAPSSIHAAPYTALEASPESSPAMDLAGLRVGIPAEYLVEELSEESRNNLFKACETLKEAGAVVVPLSLKSDNAAALSAYYLIASAEASSNLSRYDGIRYGYRAKEGSEAASANNGSADASSSSNAAEKLHKLYKRTRTEAFGDEVQRRLMVGNFALSKGARAEYYEAACEVRRLITRDFDRAFRPFSAGPQQGALKHHAEQHQKLLSSQINRYLCGLSALGSAEASVGVDVLITPTTPSPPWLSAKTKEQRPIDVYAGDIMTIPASLARLPALSVPTSYDGLAYPQEAYAAFEESVSKHHPAHKPLLEQVKAKLALPTSVQLIGRYCDEGTLLRVGAVLERKARASSSLPEYIRRLQESGPGRE